MYSYYYRSTQKVSFKKYSHAVDALKKHKNEKVRLAAMDTYPLIKSHLVKDKNYRAVSFYFEHQYVTDKFLYFHRVALIQTVASIVGIWLPQLKATILLPHQLHQKVPVDWNLALSLIQQLARLTWVLPLLNMATLWC